MRAQPPAQLPRRSPTRKYALRRDVSPSASLTEECSTFRSVRACSLANLPISRLTRVTVFGSSLVSSQL